MNGDRPLGQFPGVYTQQTSIADALLFEQLVRQQQLQRQDQEWRTRVLGGTNNSVSNPLTGAANLVAPRGLGQTPWQLPPLPRNDASLASATLQSMNRHEDSLMVAQLLRQQQQQQQQLNLRDQSGKAMMFSSSRRGQELLLGQSSSLPSLALAAAMHSERVLPEPQKVRARLDSTSQEEVDASSNSKNNMPAPPVKKKLQDLDSAQDSMPAPKKRRMTAVSSAFFPLPDKVEAPQQATPKLISFQRTWGKLEKCKMRAELFRRKLERGQVQLTGVTRSVLHQARQQQEQVANTSTAQKKKQGMEVGQQATTSKKKTER